MANAALAVTAIGWFGIQTSVFSQSFVKLADQVWNINLPLSVVIILSGLVMSTTGVIGFRGLGKLSFIATPLLILLLLLPFFYLYSDGSLSNIQNVVQNPAMPLGTLIAVVAGAYSWACAMPDLTRFCRNLTEMVKGIIANFVVAYPLLLIVTGSLALGSGQDDFMQIMLSLGLGSLAIIVLFLSTWTTNDTNVYSGALSVNLFLPFVARWKIAALVGILGTVMSLIGIFDHFMSWLIFTGNLFAPMAGVYVVDYFLNKQRYQNLADIPNFRVIPICAWMGGLIVGLSATPKKDMGFELITLTTIPMVDALVSAAILSICFHFIKNRLPHAGVGDSAHEV